MNHPIVLLLVIIGLLWLIIKAADYFVHSASHIARHFGISELILGLTLVSLGTSAPEFVVSAIAAGKGQGALALSNIVGSNIFVLGFTLGFIGIFGKARTNKTMLYRDCSILLLATFLLYLFVRDGVIERLEGVAMLILFVIWFILLFKIKDHEAPEFPDRKKSASFKEFATFFISLAVIVGGGNFLVDAAAALARTVGVSEWMIGVTIIAIGTSIPEFITSVAAMMKGKMDLGIGGLIGSGIFNIVGIIGASAAIRAIVPGDIALNSILMLLGTMAIMTFFLATGHYLRRWEASILVILAAVRVIMDILAG